MSCHLAGDEYIEPGKRSVFIPLIYCYKMKYSLVILPWEHHPQLRVQRDPYKKRSSFFFCPALGVHDSYLLIRPAKTLSRYVSPNWALRNTSEKMRVSKDPTYVVHFCRMHKLTTGLRIELLKDTRSVLGFWCKTLNQDIETRRSQRRQDLK